MGACRQGSGFTLVELLIVVLILGILAAVVIPQFSSSTLEAKEAALKRNLFSIRGAIERYRVEHKDKFPGNNINQLIGPTNINGGVGTRFGPYLREFPRNPINGMNTIRAKTLPFPANNASGWFYDRDSGEIRANSTGTGPSGIPYIEL